GVRVASDIEVMNGMTAEGQELLHARRSGRVCRADDDVAETAGNQFLTPQDERPHHDLAQLGVGLYEREQRIVIELNHLARLIDTRACERPAATDHVGFARKLTA